MEALEAITAGPFTALGVRSAGEETPIADWLGQFTPEASTSDGSGESPQIPDESRGVDAELLEAAPLLHFLRNSIGAQAHLGRHLSSPTSRRTAIIGSVKPFIPNSEALRVIFQITRPFWSIWPLAASSTIGEPGTGIPSGVSEARRYVDQQMQSASPGAVAKCLTWLALCLQQLPRDFERRNNVQLPLPPPNLVMMYLDRADALIRSTSEGTGSIECIEALIMQFKCFANLGRPKRAWKCARAALDDALFLGFHRAKDETVAGQRGRHLWSILWRQERQMALFLGLPYSVTEQSLDTEAEIAATPLENRLFHRLNIICGHITERDQARQAPSYSLTVSIAEEMEKFKLTIPAEWWLSPKTDMTTPLGGPFWRRAIIFFLHYVNNILHLPYLLKAQEDQKYEYSRHVALTSAEGMLAAFRELPTSQDLPVVCDYLDFACFSGAMILVAHLASRNTHIAQHEEERIWNIIRRFAGDMRHKATALESQVAAQSAQVLDHLDAACHGLYSGPEDYEVAIPYFGMIRITRLKSQAQRDIEQVVLTEPQQQTLASSTQHTAIEICSNAFDFRQPNLCDTDFELGQDWTAASYIGGPDDWTAFIDFGDTVL